MKHILSFLILLSVVFSACGQRIYDSDEVTLFRETRDKQFRDPNLSPLRRDDFASFEGLKYFPIDGKYSVIVTFTENVGEKSFSMPTSSGSSAKYLKIGILSFTLDGQECTLGAYRRESANPNIKPEVDSLFVPFKDLTTGKETYGAGRYVYVQMPKGNQAFLDFNLAYNPSCAYGDESFSCPVPPKENILPIEIRAGEKKFYSTSAKEEK